MAKKMTNPTKVVTGVNTRWSYANVWEPKAGQDGGKEKYSVSLIIPKSDTVTIQKIKAAIQAAYEEGAGKLKGNGKSVPALAAIKTPLRDGDIERPDDEATQTHTSSMPTASLHLRSWMLIVSRFLPTARCTPAFTAEHLSISTHTIPELPVVSPAVSVISRSSVTESRWAVNPVQRTILQTMTTMIFFHN